MRRALLPALLLIQAAPALAASEPAEEPDPGFASAAVGGVFDVLPPSGVGYPVAILAQIRIKLGGEPPAPEAPVDPAEDGH